MSKNQSQDLEAANTTNSNRVSFHGEEDEQITSIISRIQEERDGISDEEDAEEFIRKYGEIDFKFIKRPKEAVWFIKPQALNYFKDGILYRTRGERTSTKTELVLDLMYVGIIANLAGDASENAGGAALLKYILLFIPAWTVWADIKDATNFYYNGDLSQKLYIIWILSLLTLFANSHGEVLESREGAAYTIVPYILCRMSLAIGLLFYSFYTPEHRPQQRLYACFITFTCCLWIAVIFISTKAKIGLSIAIMVLEHTLCIAVFHPYTKKLLKLRMSTALNIEHEVERFATFVTIAIGEFLYKAVASSGLGAGFSDKFARGIFLIIIAYTLFWIHGNGSTCKSATHAFRRNANIGALWVYIHLPLIASLVLAADAGGDITLSDNTRLARPTSHSENIESGGFEHARRADSDSTEEEPNMYALSFFFTGSLCVALFSLTVLGLLDKSRDPKDMFLIPRFWRVFMRLPTGIIIVCLSIAELNSTVLMGIITALLILLLVFESFTSTPKNCLNSPK
ncbi:hypothetical protein CLIB1423_02S06392 [[Candida] railenensis]|uniref:Uncharacterized protein n=1 Tax=[Candida] railenensis TaxID=45579 RepID=A0A9P0QLH8_9ASCO|nr:hypothetical protein CLIB1423_02S06392 [[Candida] railenensis]